MTRAGTLVANLAVVVGVLTAPTAAHAQRRELCGPGTKYRGAPLDLDVKAADIHDVMRLLADVGGVNVVVADTVTGKVTLKLKRVAWDQIACTIAALHRLSIHADGNVLLVRPRSRP